MKVMKVQHCSKNEQVLCLWLKNAYIINFVKYINLNNGMCFWSFSAGERQPDESHWYSLKAIITNDQHNAVDIKFTIAIL